jgi:hypothetical protein
MVVAWWAEGQSEPIFLVTNFYPPRRPATITRCDGVVRTDTAFHLEFIKNRLDWGTALEDGD